MSSLRSGFRNIVKSTSTDKRSKGANFIWFLLLIAALVLLVLSLTRCAPVGLV